jgi:Leucine-rich repeat (LRR) protein
MMNCFEVVLLQSQLAPLPLGNLTALETLVLNYNQLESVPKEFGKLTALEELDLDNNQLTSVPKELGNLKVQRCRLTQF